MAVDNLLLGMGRKKIGDVVFYRSRGKQCARARNRSPKNPMTDKQKLQRAIAANVQRLYSAGYEIFNHSFQGQVVGYGNQAAFVRENMNILRRLYVNDLNNAVSIADCQGRVGVRGFDVPVPFPGMMISSGSKPQSAFTLYDSAGHIFVWRLVYDSNISDTLTVADVCAALNLKANDIFTFVVFAVLTSQAPLAKLTEADTRYDALYACDFRYAQLMVKASALTSTVTMDEATFADMFDVSGYGVSGTELISHGVACVDVAGLSQASDAILLSGCIASREDNPIRSTSFLQPASDTLNYGIAGPYLFDAWDKSRSLDGDSLILEGENF